MIDLESLSKPLLANQIDFRVQSINKGGYATILAYKDARVDINRLNASCGQLGWQRSHSRDNHNCTVSIWDDTNKHWVSKEDTGTESNAEAQKGLASDSFKRACFNWGIGIELYDYPLISIKLNSGEWELSNGKGRQTWDLKLKEWVWYVEHNESGLPTFLAAKDNNGKVRFTFGTMKVDDAPPEWEEIKDKMLSISTEGTDIELAGFIDSHMVDFSDPDENHLVNWLHKQWPNRTKSKQAARIREGRKLINSYIDIFSGNEESEMLESCEELTKLEFHIILKNMDKRGINAELAKEAYIQSVKHED